MLFVENAGPELRKKIRHSKAPCHDLATASIQVDSSFFQWTKEKVTSFFEKLFS